MPPACLDRRCDSGAPPTCCFTLQLLRTTTLHHNCGRRHLLPLHHQAAAETWFPASPQRLQGALQRSPWHAAQVALDMHGPPETCEPALCALQQPRLPALATLGRRWPSRTAYACLKPCWNTAWANLPAQPWSKLPRAGVRNPSPAARPRTPPPTGTSRRPRARQTCGH